MSSVRERYGESFWRAHHEAWLQSELNQREYCEAYGVPRQLASKVQSRTTDAGAQSALAMLVQGVLRQDPFSGHTFVFRGRKANLIKIAFWDGTGLWLFTKRLEHGVFLWPSNVEPGGTLMLNSAQLSVGRVNLERMEFDLVRT